MDIIVIWTLIGFAIGIGGGIVVMIPLWSQRNALKQIIRELRADFALQWMAQQRAIKLWQDAHPDQPNKWPDSAKLMAWLMEELEKRR